MNIGTRLGKARQELQELRDLVQPQTSTALQAFQARYRDDPVAFVHDCLSWRSGEEPADYQTEVLSTLATRRRIAARGPHGLGKTAIAAWAILWFALTRDGAADWKVITTAGAWRQLSKFLWPELHKWARRLRWDKIGRPPFDSRTELLQLALQLSTGQAFAVASDQPELIEGGHADQLLYVFDEAKSIIPGTYDSAEGALSTGEAYALSTSTPGAPQGRFYEISRRAPGFEDWQARHVTLDECIAAGRVSQHWVEQRLKQWGEQSSVYQNRCLGEFAGDDSEGVIPLGWVELAIERWHAWVEAGRPGEFEAVGVDVARFGGDQSVLALRFQDSIAELRRFAKQDTMQTAGRVKGVLDAFGGKAIVDVIGIGAGVLDKLREDNYAVDAFNASERAEGKDRSGELGFLNVRAASWWSLREQLEPSFDPTLALPPDDELIGDLTAPRWKVTSAGKIQIESKDDIRTRLGRSPDCGDAVAMACYRAPRVVPGRGVLISNPLY